MTEIYIASACLVGLCTRYDGGTNRDDVVYKLFKEGKIIPLCPEQLGGLPTPREPVDFYGGTGKDVIEGKATLKTKKGEERKENFLRGAREVLKVVRALGIRKAYLKEGSPSCGVKWVYREGKLTEGMGVTAYLLMKEGVELIGKLPPKTL